jgi:multidrug efflux system membrane fusion protein
VKTLEGVVLIPNSAIQHNGQTAFVYVIQNGTAVVRNVKSGASDAGLTAVDGVQDGEIVANSSFEKLMPNAKVTVVQSTSSNGQPAQQPAAQPVGKKGGSAQ